MTKVLASSVIRSTHRGDSHGGIYLVDVDNHSFEQVVDWNNPEIDWRGRGGDRGIRGLGVYGDKLYAVAANEVFVYDKNTFELIGSHQSKYLVLTHESWIDYDKDLLYICAYGTDSILIFDLKTEQWVCGWCHPVNDTKAYKFDMATGEGRPEESTGHMHLDSVISEGDYIYYCGAFTRNLWRINERTGVTEGIRLCLPETHNARPYRDGFLFNKSAESRTIYQVDGEIDREWQTPVHDPATLTHTHLSNDCARQGYTRGMVTIRDRIICGTSPATINVFDFNTPGQPVESVMLTTDLRNAISGMCLYE